METIMCVDNSGSTSGAEKYWDKVRSVYNNVKPERLIYWNSDAKFENGFRVYSTGGTSPNEFVKLLPNEKETHFHLIITTDGEIGQYNIDKCGIILQQRGLMPLIDTVTIYYIGSEYGMNLGLNIIFNYANKMVYHINDDDGHVAIVDFSTIEIEDILSPNLIMSLSSHIQRIKCDRDTAQERLAELKKTVIKRFSELENLSLDSHVNAKLKQYYENNQPEEFIKLLKTDRENLQSVASCKAKALNLFNTHNIDTNISRLLGVASIPEQDVPEPEPEDANAAWVDFDDNITMEPFTFPGVLIQRNTAEPIITDPTILKHPFLLLSKPDLIKKIIDLIEPTPVDYTTYKQLREASHGPMESPYTRAPCQGIFLFDAADFKAIKNNARSISVMFGTDNKVPGNLVIWNLIFMYIIYKQNRLGDEYATPLLTQLKTFCDRFEAKLSFTHQCQVLRSGPLPMCFWFCVHAVTKVTPNSSMNVMRCIFGAQLFELYLDVLAPAGDTAIAEVTKKVNKWTVWNYLIANRERPELKFEVQAQYQKYIIHNENIILVSGSCREQPGPYKCELNLVTADTANTLFKNLTNTSSKLDDIEVFKKIPVKVYKNDKKGVAECDTHVKINVETCWPYVKCPVTGLHWRECLKKNFGVTKFDVQKGSHVKFFDTYVFKHKKYPESYMDLVLYYSRKFYPIVMSDRHVVTMEHVFKLFEEIMKRYTVKEYIRTYSKYYTEKDRLAKE